ncbi:AraC family transcriptional regulator [Leifsonia sp. PS1209]|uniref:AraC family transcriptional regulator n=1 Tax=Leifsonia sp. PS1209 TaxID=2724914 RepID=UPI001442DFBB|nr:AraC family transcriptional regulator [Leifsonia sp. PS1209]QIZ97762.1 AraC family transcriptional regulator [Leifsonia sp. PS1209]
MQANSAEMFRSRRIVSCRGIDQAREALTEVFLPVDFPTARASKSVALDLNALTVGRVTVGYMQFEDAVRIETAEAMNFHVDIPTAGRATMRAAFGSPIYGTQRTAGVFMPGRPVDLDCDAGFAQVSVMIPREHLQLELESMLDQRLTRPLEFTGELDLMAPGGRAMLQTLRLIDAVSEQPGGPLSHPLTLQRLEQLLMNNLLFAQPHSHSAQLTGSAPDPGARPVSRAVELLRSSPAHPWTVSELASAVSLSVRSMHEGFRRSLDTTPMAYLRRLRLEKVREELMAAPPGTVSVTEVATRWGFVHLGRFAAAYAAAFSERPSDTLRSTGQ